MSDGRENDELTRRVRPSADELEEMRDQVRRSEIQPEFTVPGRNGFTYRPGVKTFPLGLEDLYDDERLVEFEDVQIVARNDSGLGPVYVYKSLSLEVTMWSPRQDEPDDLGPRGKGWQVHYTWSDVNTVSVIRNRGYNPTRHFVMASLSEEGSREVSDYATADRTGHPQQVVDAMASTAIPIQISRAFGYAASQYTGHCWWDEPNSLWCRGPVEIALPVR